jgi:hypothetical protein
MIRKMLVIAAAIAMPVSVIAVGATGGIAGAKAPTGAAADTIHCTTESATVNLNPPLTPAGVTTGAAARTTITSASGSISGCTVTKTPTGVALSGVTGTITGSILAKKAPSAKHPGSQCSGLLGASKEAKGSEITIAWTDTAHNAIPSTVVEIKEVIGGSSGSPAHGTFDVTGKNSGSFLGSDKGKSSSLGAETVQTTAELTTECSPSPGISSVPIQQNSAGLTLK